MKDFVRQTVAAARQEAAEFLGSEVDVNGTRNSLIDILRGLAILGVIFQHLFFEFINANVLYISFLGHRFYYFIFSNGWLGVNLFFMLSGVVLCRSSIVDNISSVINYYKSRFFRLIPALLLTILFVDMLVRKSLKRFLFNCFYITTGIFNLIPGRWMPSENFVLWSVGVEILFSFMLPLILFCQKKRDVRKYFFVAMVFCFIYRIVADHAWFAAFPTYDNYFINPYKDNIFGRLDDFVMGLYVASRLKKEQFTSGRIFSLCCGLLLVDLYVWNIVWVHQRSWSMSLLVSLAHTAFSVAMAFIILYLIKLSIFTKKWFYPVAMTGQMCYSLYIMHSMVFLYFMDLKKLSFTWLVGYLAVVYLLGFIMYLFVEIPWLHKRPPWIQWLVQPVGGKRPS